MVSFGENVTKIVRDVNCELPVALSWAVSAKNSLHNIHGFSRNQLVFGRNPNFPSVLTDKLPALEGKTTSEVVRDNLNAMHAARKAFVTSEASEKIRRALRHNVGKSVDVKYVTGDGVYYKRSSDSKWKGPGTVIGQDGQQVLVKHGSVYVRVHPCRLMLEKLENVQGHQQGAQRNAVTQAEVIPKELNRNQTISDTDDDDDDNNDDTKETTQSNDAGQIEDNNLEVGQIENAKNQQNIALPKPKQKIKYLHRNDTNWKTVKIISRAGKAKGKYKYWLNVQNENNTVECIDWENSIHLKESGYDEYNEMANVIIENPQEKETIFFSVGELDVDPMLIGCLLYTSDAADE